MLRPGTITEAVAPQIHRKIEREQAKEEPRYFQPQNAADPAEWTQKAADAAPRSASQRVRLLFHLANVAGNGWPHRLVYGSRARYGRCLSRGAGGRSFGLRRFLGALLGDASRDAHSDAQFFSELVGVHPHLKFSSAQTELVSHIL